MVSIDELDTVNGCTCIGKFGGKRVLCTTIDKVLGARCCLGEGAASLKPPSLQARSDQATIPRQYFSLSSFHYTIPHYLFIYLSHHCLGNINSSFGSHIFTPVLRKLDAEALSETAHWRLGMATQLHVKARG